MENRKLLLVTFLFSNLLIGCGMKGPLYRAPAKPSIEDEQKAPTEPLTKETIKQPLVAASEGDTAVIAVDKQQDTMSANDGFFTSSSQLLAISPAHFTLQLAALDSKDSLQQFINKHDLPQKDVYIYRTSHNNAPRYVIIFGEYESMQSAKKASGNLPGSFENMDYWIKEYRLIHQDLLLNNK